jgi:hypothetical protein
MKRGHSRSDESRKSGVLYTLQYSNPKILDLIITPLRTKLGVTEGRVDAVVIDRNLRHQLWVGKDQRTQPESCAV